MDAPEIRTQAQLIAFVAAVKTTAKFGGWTNRMRAIAERFEHYNIVAIQRSIESLWNDLTKRQKEKILKEYVILRLER